MGSHQYGVDLVTMFHPQFWGLNTAAELSRWCADHPGLMWEKIVETLLSADISLIELTFPPMGHDNAVAAFGSAAGTYDSLARAGLRIISGFHPAFFWDGLEINDAYNDLAPYAAFLAEAGASTVVLGLPETRQRLLDLAGETARADLLDRLAVLIDGVAARLVSSGLTVAIHTESHSVAVRSQDLRRLLERTDPATVGLCPDSAHLTLMGEDAVAVAAEFADRVLISHWKDAIGPFPANLILGDDIHAMHREFMRPLGTGAVNWSAWADVMELTPTADVRLLELDATLDPVGEMIRAQRFAETLS